MSDFLYNEKKKSSNSPSGLNKRDSVNSLTSIQQNEKPKFTSNMCAVLNDPRKDRNKVNYLFTKTWGSDFTDTANVPSIHHIHSAYSKIKPNEFNDYTKNYAVRHSTHVRNKLESLAKSKTENQYSSSIQTALKNADLEQIPKIFFDPNFSLANTETFNAVISFKLFEKKKKETSTNPFVNKEKPIIYEAESCKVILDKLSSYLDIIELHISKQISTKANTFFHAMTSQDEVQEHVLKTCIAVKSLRQNIQHLDQRVVLKSIHAIKLVTFKLRVKNILEKLNLMSFVYKTQPTIQLHLASSEFTGALDLIAMSQDILRQDLPGIRSLRHFDSQFSEIEKAIDKILHQEFGKYIMSDLSRSFSDGNEVLNEEKLWSLMLGILRIKMSPFIDLCKDEIFIYLKSTVKQTIVEYVSQVDDDDISNIDDDNYMRLSDRIKQLKMQEFLHLLSRVLTNVKIMLGRVKSIVKVIQSVVNSAAGFKSEENIDYNQETVVNSKELISKALHLKHTGNLRDLLTNSSNYAQERLVNLLEGKFKENTIEKLNSNDFISLSNLIDQFIIDFDSIANKKTSSLRSWLQNQANKFMQKFHNEKKDKLNLALESERWKQSEVPADFQNLIENLIKNGIGSSMKKFDSRTKNPSEFLLINNDNYVIFGTVIVLIKLMVEYCQFSIDMPNLSFDVMTRLVEIFQIFNAKTYHMILGAGVVQFGILRVVTFKHLAITIRCLEIVLFFLPMINEFFKEKLVDKQSNTDKQFNQLTTRYTEHKMELNNKLINSLDEVFRDLLCSYEVIAPVPSQCFRSICQQISRVHEIVSEILGPSNVLQLFTDIHGKFKSRLGMRLRELGVVGDGGPQHALIYSDMTHYIKQFKNLKGLHVISLNCEDVLQTTN